MWGRNYVLKSYTTLYNAQMVKGLMSQLIKLL